MKEKRLFVHDQELVDAELPRYYVWRHRCADSEKAMGDLQVCTGPSVSDSHDVPLIRGVLRKPPNAKLSRRSQRSVWSAKLGALRAYEHAVFSFICSSIARPSRP